MNTTKPNDWREYRRFQAYELRQQGWRNSQIAKALSVSKGAVSQWFKRVDEAAGNKEVLRHHPAPGVPRKLRVDQMVELPILLAKGATSFGFVGDIWTGTRVARLIKMQYGISYHPKHVCRLLKFLGWTPQKPVEKASQRDEAAIEKWQAERWPDLKKKPKKKVMKSPS
jgi:transposase